MDKVILLMICVMCAEHGRQSFDSLYEVGQVLGGGGFGTVYSGRRRYDELPVSWCHRTSLAVCVYLPVCYRQVVEVATEATSQLVTHASRYLGLMSLYHSKDD